MSDFVIPAPPVHTIPTYDGAVQMHGFVPDIKAALKEYAVFVCPILSGSGVRVKLLEAFAAGIPCVSTRIGAEGITDEDGPVCRLSDDPREFADRVIQLFADQEAASAMAARAKRYVDEERDIARMTESMVVTFRRALAGKAASRAS